jgi:hypothetical protein
VWRNAQRPSAPAVGTADNDAHLGVNVFLTPLINIKNGGLKASSTGAGGFDRAAAGCGSNFTTANKRPTDGYLSADPLRGRGPWLVLPVIGEHNVYERQSTCTR